MSGLLSDPVLRFRIEDLLNRNPHFTDLDQRLDAVRVDVALLVGADVEQKVLLAPVGSDDVVDDAFRIPAWPSGMEPLGLQASARHTGQLSVFLLPFLAVLEFCHHKI